MKSWG
jgi:hypothetical protein